MAETDRSGGGKSGNGEDWEWPGVGDETSRLPIDDQPMEEAPTSSSVEVQGSGDDNGGHATGVGSGRDWRTPVGQGHTPVGYF